MKIAVLIIIIGIVVGAVFYGNAEHKKKNRAEAMAFEQQVSFAQAQHAQITESLRGVEDFSPKVWEVLATVSNMVPGIVGEENAVRVYDKDYEKKQKAAARPKPAAAPVQSGGATQPVAAPKVGVVVDEMGREAPAGLGLDNLKRSESVQAAADATAKTGEAARPSPRSSSSADSRGLPEKVMNRIIKCQEHIEKVVEHAENIEGKIAEAATIIQESGKLLDQVMKSTSAFNASKLQTRYMEMVPMVKDFKKLLQDDLQAAESVIPLMTAMKEELDEENRLREEAEAAKRRAEQEAADRDRQLADAANWYEGKADLLMSYQFDAARAGIDDLKESLTLEEARASLEIPALRYQFMHNAMSFLKGSFNKAPMRWAWRGPSGGLDIEKADDEGIYVQGKLIRWLDIPKDKMIEFFLHYLDIDKQIGKPKAELYAGVALYAKTFGHEASIDNLVNKATNESPLTARQVPALMDFTPDPALNRE